VKTFEELYFEVLSRTIRDRGEGFLEGLSRNDPHQLDCLLHPEKQPVIWKTGACDCGADEPACLKACVFDAISRTDGGEITVDGDKCVGCARCVQECPAKKLTESKDAIAVLRKIYAHEGLVYALIAPAFLGQFPGGVTPGKLRNALKLMGFDGMIEVSLFADILTLKEALEFDRSVTKDGDYQLTSCCCPMWIAMLRKVYSTLMPHVPPSVSPMIAAGRAIKRMHPDAVTVFIGPCLAKKSEAREKDIAGAIDYVLTFTETRDILDIMHISPETMSDEVKDHSSRAGRLYARAGGVSEAVSETLRRINPSRDVPIRVKTADGVPACKAMIEEIANGTVTANFYEGMGCVGGCVGGPKALIPRDEGKSNVEQYGSAANHRTPIDNPYVIEMLHQLGFESVENLLDNHDILARKFD
jgi:iron only hydrogenase large subunit-like protein